MDKDELDRIDEISTASLERFTAAGSSLKAARVSKDEAIEVFDAYAEILLEHPEYRSTLRLVGNIYEELARGWRCPVCFDIDNDDCIEGC